MSARFSRLEGATKVRTEELAGAGRQLCCSPWDCDDALFSDTTNRKAEKIYPPVVLNPQRGNRAAPRSGLTRNRRLFSVFSLTPPHSAHKLAAMCNT